MWWPFRSNSTTAKPEDGGDDVVKSMDEDLQQFMADQVRTTTGIYIPIETPDYVEEKSISANMADNAGVSQAESRQLVANAVSLNCLDFQSAFQKCTKEKYAIQCNDLLRQFHDCLNIQTQTLNQLNFAQQTREDRKVIQKRVDKAFMQLRPENGQENAYLSAVGL